MDIFLFVGIGVIIVGTLSFSITKEKTPKKLPCHIHSLQSSSVNK